MFVAYYRRSLPGFKQIKHWLDAAEIGQVRHIHWQYTRPPSTIDLAQTRNWRTQKEIAKAGYFEDIASHGLDLMSYFLGPVKQAQGVASNQQGLYSAYDAVAASLLFESGVTGTGFWNFAADRLVDKVQIMGESGQISFSVFEDGLALLESKDKYITYPLDKPSPVQADFVSDIAFHLAGKSLHPSLAESAAHTNWLMDTILKDA
ncbi:Gfo/Idh/MocA family protein [Paraglaciecola hydrolytica]|uniref:Gfo/Idh/MocA family protein n=1 Tax=Paraglaciecola hydrolytica TaxID=1799789 RepID=UPI002286BA3D|nr:Gfo/Idh/MocA family oxidoreductase [Paraglaciecola hydrolytica]